MKKKYAFGRPGEVDKLRFPKGYDKGEGREKITTKGVIFEVELVQFIRRNDINHNGSIFKQVLNPPTLKHDHEIPNDLDDVEFSVKAYQGRGDVFARFQGEATYELETRSQLKEVKSNLIKHLVE